MRKFDNSKQITIFKTELKLRGFTKNTQKTYIAELQRFNNYLKKNKKQIDNLTKQDIKEYLAYLISDKELDIRSISLTKSALKFYFHQVLEKTIVEIKTPKQPKKLPQILRPEQIKQMIEHSKHRKTKLIIKFLYSTGLRVSELCNLKVKDIDLDFWKGYVREGKGQKDRLFFISKKIIKTLKNHIYYYDLKPNDYLFPNTNWERTSERNIQKMIKKAAENAGLTQKVTPHTLRHSFATQLMKKGTNLRIIQRLLGHENIQTTQIYLHLSDHDLKDIKNPLDYL